MLGSANVFTGQKNQGSLPEIERKFLFIGIGATGVNTVVSLNAQSDLDVALGIADSEIKTQALAAQLNGGPTWEAWAVPIALQGDWSAAVDLAMLSISPEAIVVCTPATTDTELNAFQAKAVALLNTYARHVFFLCATAGIDNTTQTWAAYATAQDGITSGVAADRVSAVPQTHGNNLGVLAGRLCRRDVSIADSPMRVRTGAVVGLGTAPNDLFGDELGTATLATLDASRLTVVQWYPDYPGVYFGDLNILDVPGGDYQAGENLRVVLKAARAIRLLAIPRIADRSLNSTPISMALNKTYFMAPLRAMAKVTVFAGQQLPGEIKPPADTAIEIVWESNTSVKIYFSLTPYESGKEINAYVFLDLSTPV